ncbi:MAG: tetratricopeptide repeat protein [Myxococcales bacterium]
MPVPRFVQASLVVARRPAVGVSLVVSALAGSLLTRLPLFEVPGYELASAMGLLLAVAGAIAGFVSARQARTAPPASALSAWLHAIAPCLATLLFPFLAAVVSALLSTRCSPWMGAPFYLVIPVPTVLLACAVGVVLGLSVQRAFVAGLAYFGLVLATVAASLWPLWEGPQVFALNHLVGYFPGPLYDESLPLEPRLLFYRALTLVWTALALLFAHGWLDPQSGRLGSRYRRGKGVAAAMALLVLAVALARLFEFDLGLRTRHSDLAKRLDGTSETAHFVLHYPKGKDALERRRLERDAEFKYERVVAFLGAAPAGKIHAWFHENADVKRARVGAASTNFAKPWHLELHVHDEAFPHRVLRHEMAHDVASAFGAWPFGVSARLGVLVNVGLVEGLAVAADADTEELTAHQWAAAMRRLKIAPDIRNIVGPAGFYREAAARAYTLSGSFLRWLRDTFGAEKLRRLYRDGDFEAAYGRSLDSLANDWEAYLDRVELDERALHTAQLQFERGSVFDRPCAREMALLKAEADALRQADPERSLALYQRCADIEPKNPAYLRAQAEVRAGVRDWAGARAAWERILAMPEQPAGVQARALMGLGDALWWQGQPDEAKTAYEKALALHRDRGSDRTAFVKIEALGGPEADAAIRRYFDEPEAPSHPRPAGAGALAPRERDRALPGGPAAAAARGPGRGRALARAVAGRGVEGPRAGAGSPAPADRGALPRGRLPRGRRFGAAADHARRRLGPRVRPGVAGPLRLRAAHLGRGARAAALTPLPRGWYSESLCTASRRESMGRLLATAAVTLLLFPTLASAKAWNGITPNETKRADVLAKFGEPSKVLKQGDKEVLGYLGKKAIAGTSQAQFTLTAAGVVEQITVFPANKPELSEIEESYGKSCEATKAAEPCYGKKLLDDFKTVFVYKKLGLMIFFGEDKKTVHSLVFTAPK